MNTTLAEVKPIDFWSGVISNKTTIILISGKIGAGKTTFANVIHKQMYALGLISLMKSFATPIKYCAVEYYKWDRVKDERGRKLLQDLGRIGREYDEDLWVNILLESLDDMIPPDVVIVDDWRFPNELERIKQLGIYDIITLRIIRPTAYYTTDYGTDISETALKDNDDYDYVIYNDKSLEVFESKAVEFTEHILKNYRKEE